MSKILVNIWGCINSINKTASGGVGVNCAFRHDKLAQKEIDITNGSIESELMDLLGLDDEDMAELRITRTDKYIKVHLWNFTLVYIEPVEGGFSNKLLH